MNYVHDSVKEGDGFDVDNKFKMHYKAWAFEQDDNFTQVDVKPDKISVVTFDKKGKKLTASVFKL